MLELAPDDPTLGLVQVLDEDGTLDRQRMPEVEPPLVQRMYREMLRVRRLDEKMLARQRQGKVGFFGTVTGQEATPVGTALALTAEDWVFPALRENSIMLVRGFPLTKWLAQVYGNTEDVLKGRQMPSHQSGRAENQVSRSSCIGTQLTQAVGAAWAAKLRGDRVATVGFMGDGATSEPEFHCAMNFAGVYRTPCVLICQNNHWSISVPTERQTASTTIAIKAHAYGIPGVRIDGNDVLAVYSEVKRAAERARTGGGPTFIEAVTYRVGPHSSSDDPTRYRSDEEVERWRRRDPILRVGRYLRSAGLLDDDRQLALEAELDAEIGAAIHAVEDAAQPARESLFEDVFKEEPWHLSEQRETLRRGAPGPKD